jgi:hypothetical protein
VFLGAWATEYARQWAGHRAATSVQPGDGGAWITGPYAKGIVCDAALFPIVAGTPDPRHLDGLINLCVKAYHELNGNEAGDGDTAGPDADHAAQAARAERLAELARDIFGQCATMMSGPGGLAAVLRRNLLGQVGLGGPSLPLDVGDRDNIPWWIRRTVQTRDQFCQWPGGCDQPAAATQPHHVVHRADRGATKIENLYCLCWWHHHVMIHQRGWDLRVRGDGTLESKAPDGRIITKEQTRPPPRPG